MTTFCTEERIVSKLTDEAETAMFQARNVADAFVEAADGYRYLFNGRIDLERCVGNPADIVEDWIHDNDTSRKFFLADLKKFDHTLSRLLALRAKLGEAVGVSFQHSV